MNWGSTPPSGIYNERADISSSVPKRLHNHKYFVLLPMESFKIESRAQFSINSARSWNYTGPQQEFKLTEGSDEQLNNYKANNETSENTSRNRSVDWNKMVDNVFMEEIAKLSTGYSTQRF